MGALHCFLLVQNGKIIVGSKGLTTKTLYYNDTYVYVMYTTSMLYTAAPKPVMRGISID